MAEKTSGGPRGDYAKTYESLAAIWEVLSTKASRNHPMGVAEIAGELATNSKELAAKKKKLNRFINDGGLESVDAIQRQSILCQEDTANIVMAYSGDKALHVVVESPEGDVQWDGDMTATFILNPGNTPSANTVGKQLQRMEEMQALEKLEKRKEMDPKFFADQLMCVKSNGKTLAGKAKYVPYDKEEVSDLSQGRDEETDKRNNVPRRYYIKSLLTEQECRMLSDLVAVYPYISKHQTAKFQAALGRFYPGLKAPERYAPKQDSKLFRNMEILDEAIESKKQVVIHYGEYVLEKQDDAWVPVLQKRMRHGELTFHPYAMMWSNGYYYLVGKQIGMMNLRLDRIISVVIQHNKPFQVDGRLFNPATHRDKCPVMYPGKPDLVVLRCKLGLVNTVLDFFGQEAKFSAPKQDTVDVSLYVAPGGVKLFALQYLSGVEVIAPQSLRDAVIEELQSALGNYM